MGSHAALGVITDARDRQRCWWVTRACTALVAAVAAAAMVASLTGGGAVHSISGPATRPHANGASAANLMPCGHPVGQPGNSCPQDRAVEASVSNLGRYAVFYGLGENGALTVAEDLPAAVRTVTVRFAANRPAAITVHLVAKGFVIHLRRPANALPIRIVWYGRGGRIIRSIALQ
jgi:hypothetical protein